MAAKPTEGVLLSAKLPQSPNGDSPLTEGAENDSKNHVTPHGRRLSPAAKPPSPAKGGGGGADGGIVTEQKRLKKYETTPQAAYAQDVFRFRSRNRRCSADEEKLRETLRVSYSSPCTGEPKRRTNLGRGRRPDDPHRTQTTLFTSLGEGGGGGADGRSLALCKTPPVTCRWRMFSRWKNAARRCASRTALPLHRGAITHTRSKGGERHTFA